MTAAEIEQIVALGAPVLCADTCTILDIMRDPTRENIRPNERRAAVDLLIAMETGVNLTGLIAEQVRLEFLDHAASVENEAAEALKKLRAQIFRVDQVAAIFGGSGKADLGHLDGHVGRSRSVVDRWMTVAKPVNNPVKFHHVLMRE